MSSIFYSVQTISMNHNLDLVKDIDLINTFDHLYMIFIYALYILIPVTTLIFVLSFIHNIFSNIKLYGLSKKDIVILSDVNDRTIAMLQNIQNSTIVYLNYRYEEDKQELKNIKCIKIMNRIRDIKFDKLKNKNLKIYLFDEDEDVNLNDALYLIEHYKNQKMKVYLFNQSLSARTILDSVDKGEIQLDIIDELERIVYQLLDRRPLYLNAINSVISVLIMGDLKHVLEFLKTIIWCGQIIGYQLEINVISEDAILMEEYLKVNCKELLEHYHVKFLCNKLDSLDGITFISNIKPNYIIITYDNDDLNINNAIFLRMHLPNHIDPIINVKIQHATKSKQIKDLMFRDRNYQLHSFGSMEQIYGKHSIIDSKIEKLAIAVHLAYETNGDSMNDKMKRFYQNSYFIKSSRASGLHFKYKIYSILKEQYQDDLKKDFKLFKEKLKDPNIFEMLAYNEHERWMAFVRSDGYTLATIEEARSYMETYHNHVDHIAKKHPALVPYDKLDDVAKKIQRFNLKQLDSDMILNMENIYNILINE